MNGPVAADLCSGGRFVYRVAMSGSLTDQQRAAVEHRGSSVVLASGAGCGKTHVLTTRYLSHLTADAAGVGQVVAITFTERAAREMRDRIRTAVEKLRDPQPHLRALETAPIATIHGFCGTLLRQFAVPAGLDPGFEVLDDVLSANLRTEALTECLHGLLTYSPGFTPGPSPAPGVNPGLCAEALRELVVLFGWNAVVEAIDRLLLAVDRPAWQAWLARSPADIAAEWLGPVRAGLLPEWVAYLCAASPKIARCLSVLETVRSTNPKVTAKVQPLLAELPRLHEAADLAAKVDELVELAKVQGTTKKDWPDEATYEAVKDAFTDFRADLPKRFDLFAASAEGVADAARVGQLFLRVALTADDVYRTHKRRAGVLDFQDLLVLARDLLRDHADVRKSLQSRFRFLLLDELQDTDPVQMELVELLCGAGLEHGKLFAVGDHKQSIYRFRGAEVGLFQNLRRSVAAEGRLGLTRNFRSQPGVLKFVNALFSKRIPDYEPLVPNNPAAGDPANVELLWAIPRAGGVSPPSPNPTRGADTPRSDVAALRAQEADAIARRLVQLLNDPTPRVLAKDGTARRVERKDITLLFRSMTHVANYEAALRRHGLDYYLVGGRAFFAQQEVYDLLNLLRAVENPHDAASLVGLLRSPFCGLSDEAVFLLAVHPDGPWAGLHDAERLATLPDDQKPAADRAARWLAKWREVKDKLPIARLLNTVFADTGYDAAMQFEFLGDRKLANLWKLVDLARSFDRTGLFGLPEFIARLGDLVARQPREEQAATLPETADVVKLMSIHQAKGLEFPVVVVPDLAAQGRGDRHPVARWHRGLGCLVKLPAEFEELPEGERPPFADFADALGRTADQLADWQEDLRVLYVACTRARDLLILSAGVEDANEPLPANHWTLALMERFDVRTGRCIAGDVTPDDVPVVRVTVMEPGEPSGGCQPPEDLLLPSGGCQPPESGAEVAGSEEKFLEEKYSGGLHPPLRAESFDTEADTDRSQWRHPRERLGSFAPADAALWVVFDRWDFADVDGWGQLLADAIEEAADPRIADELRPKLLRFAESDLRAELAAAGELHRGVEFVADLRDLLPSPLEGEGLGVRGTLENLPSPGGAAPPPSPSRGEGKDMIRGIIDFLFRDADGWHVLGLDRGTTDEDDPWRGRLPGLVLAAWVVFRQFGEWPASVELFDLATGQRVRADPRRVKLATVAEHFRRVIQHRP